MNAEKQAIILKIIDDYRTIQGDRILNTIVFLIQNKLKENINFTLNYEFFETITGAYSPDMMEDIINISNAGFINIKRNNEREYVLSEFGKTAYDFSIKKQMPTKTYTIIKENTQKYKKMTQTQLNQDAEKYKHTYNKEKLIIFK